MSESDHSPTGAGGEAGSRKRLRLRVVAGALAITGALGFAADVFQLQDRAFPDPPPPPRPLSGDLNFAVAELTDEGKRTQGTAVQALSDIVHRTVEERLRANRFAPRTIDSASPSEVGGLKDASPNEFGKVLTNIAAAHRADIILFGDVRSGPRADLLTLRIFISPDEVTNAGVLAGVHLAGAPIVLRNYDAGSAQREQIGALIQRRVAPLAALMIGASNYDERRYPLASRVLETAGRSSDASQRRLAELFLGNIALKQFQFLEAREHYFRALERDETYPRARLGLADAALGQARGDCNDKGIDRRGLERSYLDFVAVTSAADDPDRAAIEGRKRFGLAQVRSCQAIDGDGRRVPEARALFREVIERARQAPALSDAAAESHAQLALLDQLYDPSPSGLNRAGAEYREAIAQARDPDRCTVFYDRLANVYNQAGQTRRAAEAAFHAWRLRSNAAPEEEGCGV